VSLPAVTRLSMEPENRLATTTPLSFSVVQLGPDPCCEHHHGCGRNASVFREPA
jgi:hypothetical protein